MLKVVNYKLKDVNKKMKKMLLTFFVMSYCLSLISCGSKGSLYLPPEDVEEKVVNTEKSNVNN